MVNEPGSTSHDVAASLYDAFGAGDIERIISLLDPAVVWELVGPDEIPYFGRYEGVAEVRTFFERLGEWCIVEQFEVSRIVETERGALAEGLERGRFTGRDAGYDMRWCHVMTISSGRITAFTDYLDTAPMLAAWRS